MSKIFHEVDGRSTHRRQGRLPETIAWGKSISTGIKTGRHRAVSKQ